jgi:hypothetical protein
VRCIDRVAFYLRALRASYNLALEKIYYKGGILYCYVQYIF